MLCVLHTSELSGTEPCCVCLCCGPAAVSGEGHAAEPAGAPGSPGAEQAAGAEGGGAGEERPGHAGQPPAAGQTHGGRGHGTHTYMCAFTHTQTDRLTDIHIHVHTRGSILSPNPSSSGWGKYLLFYNCSGE